MKVLSKGTVYGLRALIYVAAHAEPGRYVSIREITDELGISFHFLTKTFQSLTQQNILASYRGPNGGVTLTKAPEEIFLIDIVRVLEGPDFFSKCLLGLPGCGVFAPCPVHDFWSSVRSAMEGEFHNTSLADLGRKINEDRLRLAP
jgi:Rrf2 family protein